jgi:hypothetical protein
MSRTGFSLSVCVMRAEVEVRQAKQAAEKLKFLSFRGTLRAEESLILLTLEPGEIPHFVRNDKIAYFFRSL